MCVCVDVGVCACACACACACVCGDDGVINCRHGYNFVATFSGVQLRLTCRGKIECYYSLHLIIHFTVVIGVIYTFPHVTYSGERKWM